VLAATFTQILQADFWKLADYFLGDVYRNHGSACQLGGFIFFWFVPVIFYGLSLLAPAF